MRILIRCTIICAFLAVVLVMNGDSFAARGWLLKALCDDSRLYCITIRKGETWQSLFPESERRDTVMRINRMNTRLWSGMQIAIPRDPYSINSMDYTPFSPYRIPSGQKMVVYSPMLNAWAAYGPAGNIIRWGPASSGQNWCPDLGKPCHTPSGNFKVYDKRGPGCTSTKFPKPDGGAPMPYCMFFKGGFAMHGSNGVLGYNASHGCIRLFLEDAEWLNRDFVDIGTQVIILPYPLNQYAQRDDEYDDDKNDNDDDDERDAMINIIQTDSGE